MTAMDYLPVAVRKGSSQVKGLSGDHYQLRQLCPRGQLLALLEEGGVLRVRDLAEANTRGVVESQLLSRYVYTCMYQRELSEKVTMAVAAATSMQRTQVMKGRNDVGMATHVPLQNRCRQVKNDSSEPRSTNHAEVWLTARVHTLSVLNRPVTIYQSTHCNIIEYTL